MAWQEVLLDRITFDDVLGTPGTEWPIGTPGVPSDVIADVITMCTNRNLRKINVHGAVTLGAIMEHYCFFGSEHQDIADQVSLNGQDVDGSHFEGLIVTGAQGGAAFLTLIECTVNALTLFAGRMKRCSFYTSTCSFRDASFIDLVDCESVSGAVTITVQAPTRASIKNWRGNLILTAQDGGVCHVRGYKGYLEIDAMTAGTLNVFANGADIAINGDCTGGTINIFGNARVTGAGGGVVINNYTLEGRTKGLDDIHDRIGGASTEGTYSLPNDLVENTAFTIPAGTPGSQRMTLQLDLSNLVQNVDIRVKYDMHGDGAVIPIMETFNWTVGMDDIVYFREISGQRAVTVTVQSLIVQGAVKDIDYEYTVG